MSRERETGPAWPAAAEPTPLSREGGAARFYLETANRAFAPGPAEEARAWALLEERQARPRRGGAWLALLAVGGAAAVAAAVPLLSARFAQNPTTPPVARRTEVLTPAPPASPPALPAPAPEAVAPPIEPLPQAAAPAPSVAEISRPLRPGRAVMAEGVRAWLSSRGVARLLGGATGSARIALERGRIDVVPSAQRPVEVSAAAFRFEGEGSQFSVSVDRRGVDLVVRGGRVSVWSSRRLVARVVAGQRWSNLSARADGARAGGAADCLGLARGGRADDAIACFEGQSARPGLTGELALVELARIRRDVKGDLAGAERALAEHRRRFPSGALSAEVAASRIELLLGLGRAGDALAEATRMTGGEAAYFRGLALARLGRRDEARRALNDYLARADGAHHAEALERRRELGP